jgi:hypothetical protein
VKLLDNHSELYYKNELIMIGESNQTDYKIILNILKTDEYVLSVWDTDDYLLWHSLLGHLGRNSMYEISKILKFKFPSKIPKCCNCNEGKQTKIKFHNSLTRATHPGHLLHTDLCGPLIVSNIPGKRYILVIYDEFTRYIFTEVILD